MITSQKTETTSPSLAYCSMVVAIYIGFIVVINVLFDVMPRSYFLGHEFTYADFLVGAIYVIRDLAQRAIGQKVIFAMILAAIICYFMADQQIALASLSAFAIGEFVDWAIFTYTKKPLSKRIILSASVSSPIDSAVFLGMLGLLAPFEFALMTSVKILGAVFVWWVNNLRETRLARVSAA